MASWIGSTESKVVGEKLCCYLMNVLQRLQGCLDIEGQRSVQPKQTDGGVDLRLRQQIVQDLAARDSRMLF